MSVSVRHISAGNLPHILALAERWEMEARAAGIDIVEYIERQVTLLRDKYGDDSAVSE